MKKVLIAVTIIFALSLAACGQNGQSSQSTEATTSSSSESGHSTIEGVKTIGEARALVKDGSYDRALYGDYFILAFNLDNVTWQFISEMPEDVSEEAFELAFADEEEKLMEFVAPLSIIKYSNLTEKIPSQAEIDKWVGKTIRDLVDAGWYNSGWSLNDKQFWMSDGMFDYTVIAEDEITDPDNFTDEDMYSLTIKSITCDGILDATHIELDEDGKLISE